MKNVMMRNRIVRVPYLLAVAAICLLFSSCSNQVASTAGIGGIGGEYSVSGTNPDGTTYQGRASVSQQNGVYHFRWDVGGQRYYGQGQLRGVRLIVDWAQEHPAIYEVRDDGATLSGTWANGHGTEVLRRN